MKLPCIRLSIKPSLFILGFSIFILGTNQSLGLAQIQNISRTKNNSHLVKAFKTAISSELWNSSKVFFSEFDLNNDNRKEIILYIISPACGIRNCNISVLQKQGSNYKEVLSGIAIGAKIALLNSKSNGWFDLATESYDLNLHKQRWLVWKFNGKMYEPSSQYLKNTPKKMILDPKPGSEINLKDLE